MSVNDFINLLVNNGMALGITAYFLYRDYKFNQQQIELLTTLKNFLNERGN